MQGTLLPYKGIYPKIGEGVFIAPTATIIGDVEIAAGANIWYGCIVRGDINHIRIGERANVQDMTVVHVDGGYPAIIGADVVIGHTAIVHACVLEDASMVGMQACVMDGSVVEEGAMVAAGALVTPGKHIEKGQLWAGVPAKYIRELGPEDLAMRRDICERYMGIARDHMESLAGIGD